MCRGALQTANVAMPFLDDRRCGNISTALVFGRHRGKRNIGEPAVDDDDFRAAAFQLSEMSFRITDGANDKPFDLPRLEMRQQVSFVLVRVVAIGEQGGKTVPLGVDGGLSGDGGEEWVGSIGHDKPDQTRALRAERAGDVAGLEAESAGRLEDRLLRFWTNSALASLAGECPGGGRRGNPGSLGNVFERNGSGGHDEFAGGKIDKNCLHKRLCNVIITRVGSKINNIGCRRASARCSSTLVLGW